jgi:thiol-disulfide isomerase/thioredoxin
LLIGISLCAAATFAATAAAGESQLVAATGNDSASAHAGFLSRTLRDLDGNEFSFASQRGRVLVVNFWAGWCPPCREEIPQLVALDEAYRERGVTVVGVGLDHDQLASELGGAYGIRYRLLSGKNDAAALMQSLGNNAAAIPFTVVFDREGRLVAAKRGAADAAWLEQTLTPLL